MAKIKYKLEVTVSQDAIVSLNKPSSFPDNEAFIQYCVEGLINGWQQTIWDKDIRDISERWDDITDEVRNQVKSILNI